MKYIELEVNRVGEEVVDGNRILVVRYKTDSRQPSLVERSGEANVYLPPMAPLDRLVGNTYDQAALDAWRQAGNPDLEFDLRPFFLAELEKLRPWTVG